MADSFAQIRGEDQWKRVSHEDTALVGEILQLAWNPEDGPAPADDAPSLGAGLAFDGECRLYHSLPDEGQVERVLWQAEDPLKPRSSQVEPLELFVRQTPSIMGDFHPVAPDTSALQEPRGLAVDEDDRLYIAEAGERAILVFDLWSRRLLQRINLTGRPLDLVAHGSSVYVVTEQPAALLRLRAHGLPEALTLPDGLIGPARIACSLKGEIFLLDGAATAHGRIINLAHPGKAVKAPYATDIEFYSAEIALGGDVEPVLVAARRPGEDFLRYRLGSSGLEEITPLTARGYDGLGIVRTPDDRIAYWRTGYGLRYGVAARLRYRSSGRVIGFRLDSGAFQTQWGRLLIDACIPRDTDVRVHCIVLDEPPETGNIPRTPPVFPDPIAIPHDDLSLWSMPPDFLVPDSGTGFPLHRRVNGPELPWLRRAADDPFETYEAPVLAEPGRYLWVILELTGNSRSTPRIRAIRAEYPGHDYLRRIPKVLSREGKAASFLQRYLAPFAGALMEWEGKANERKVLLNPKTVPQELLPWLAGFVGLVLDERWSIEAKRRLIEEAIWLFRFRGTIPGLSRFLEIVTGATPIIVEKFKLRGGGVIGESKARGSRAIVGAGFRVGGSVGTPDETALPGQGEDAFETHAHRFVVMLPTMLTEEQTAMVEHLLDVHRPAHTLYELCTVGAGMRVGRGLHIGLTSMTGRSSGFSPLQLGAAALGRDSIVGQPVAGTWTGSSRTGQDSRIG